MIEQQGHADAIEVTLSGIIRFLKLIMSIKTHIQYIMAHQYDYI